MSTPYDPGRPEDRPADQPGYPPAPPPQPGYPPAPPPQPGGQQYPPGGQQYGGQGGYAGGPPEYPAAPPPPQYGNQPEYGGGQQYGGQQYGQYGNAPQYGSAPRYGEPYEGAPAPATPPKETIWATQLMFVRVALGILSALLTFAAADSIKDSIRESNPSLTADEVNSAYAIGVGVAIFFGLVFAVLYILLAIQVRKGKNWARIVTWVLAGLGVISGLLGLAAAAPALERLLDILILLVDAAIIVLLALRPSSQYFAAQKAPRY